MNSAERESVRLVLDQTDTPEDALARRILARPVFEFDLDNPLRVDCCDVCGALNWRECVCDPNAPRPAPTAEEIECAREARLTRAERKADGQ